MPVATEHLNEQDRLDDQLIQQTLSNIDGGGILPDQDRDLDIGDKADDAVDFADLSDDDLADDEDAAQPFESDLAESVERGVEILLSASEEKEFGAPIENGTDFDDLFGDMPSSPVDIATKDVVGPFDMAGALGDASSEKQDTSLFGTRPGQINVEIGGRDVLKKAGLSKEEQIQRNLFAMSKMSSDAVPQPVENAEELLNTLWPRYKRHTIPYFMELVPGRRMYYHGKLPLKPPRTLQTNKLNLELAPDQEKNFKVSMGASKRPFEELEHAGIIPTRDEDTRTVTDEEILDIESDYENDVVGDISWQDLQIACQGWEVASLTNETQTPESDYEEELDQDLEWPPAKVRNCMPWIRFFAYAISSAAEVDALARKSATPGSDQPPSFA